MTDPPTILDSVFSRVGLWFRSLPTLMVVSLVVLSPLAVQALMTAKDAGLEADDAGEADSDRAAQTGEEPTSAAEEPDPDVALRMAMVALLSMVLRSVLVGCVTQGMRFGVGRSIRIGDCFSIGGRGLMAAVSVGLLQSLVLAFLLSLVQVFGQSGAGIGALFVCLPVMIWVFTSWFLATPAAVVEQKGTLAALARSTRLVRGSRFGILFLLFGLSALFVPVYLVLEDVLRDAAIVPLVMFVLQAIASAGLAVVSAGLYLDFAATKGD